MIVGTITAYKHRGWVRVVMTANTGKVLGMDLDVTDAMIFLWQLEAALVGSSRRLRACPKKANAGVCAGCTAA